MRVTAAAAAARGSVRRSLCASWLAETTRMSHRADCWPGRAGVSVAQIKFKLGRAGR